MLKVFVADDNREFSDLLVEYLSSSGYRSCRKV